MPRLNVETWAVIEQEYRTGAYSLREIGRRYGVSHQAVNSQAKKNGWKRDLSARLKAEVKRQTVEQDGAKVDKGDAKDGNLPAPRVSDDEVVEKAAGVVVAKVNHHRRITEEQAKGIEAIQAQINSILDKAKDLPLKAEDLRILAQAQRQISGAALNTINCDRRSYNMDEAVDDPNAPSAIKITFYREAPMPVVGDKGK